jgi:hypothetical protein
MPPLATSRVDDDALRLLRDWIQGLEPPAVESHRAAHSKWSPPPNLLTSRRC